MSLLSYFKPESRRRFLFCCAVSLLAVLVTFGAFAGKGLFTVEGVAVAAGMSTSVPLEPPPPPAGAVAFDFTNDGKADIGRWNPAAAEFRVKNSTTGAYTAYTIGTSAAKAAPGRFDSDTMTDPAVFNAGTWTIRRSSNGTTFTIAHGQAGDIPVAGNYETADSITDAAVFRPSTNTWLIRKSSNAQVISTVWGQAGDIPVPGNYDGDGLSDYAVFRPSTGVWYIIGSSVGQYTVSWGQNGDVPVPADYDNDNKTDIAVFRRSTGTWYVIKSYDGAWLVQNWGNYGDQPTPADYDGDNKADLSVWRPTTGTWYTIKSSNGAFDVQQLGVAGDTAVPSAYLKQVGGTVSAAQLAQDRLSPKNATGGTDYYSRNFAWSTSLVNLPGRAGLNAGFGLGYNSLVWTKSGSEIYFDTDYSNVTPGFRLGFPTIEPSYLDSKTGRFAYLMVTPSGSRVEFRQIGATAFYDTADSGYVQLKAPKNSNPNSPLETMILVVTGTDGTQMNYAWNTGAFRCTQIKDPNGNYVTITYGTFGELRTMTDTLGRIVTVNYDPNLYPTSITQTWKNNNGNGADFQYTWASFAYTTQTITTNFTSLSVIGPPNGTVVKVLDKVIYPDLSYTKFTHNSYGQVWKVQNYAADNHELNYVKTNLETPAASYMDAPRLAWTDRWVENFNNGVATRVHNTLTAGQSFNVGGMTGTGAMIEVYMAGHPDNLRSRTFVGESGWGGKAFRSRPKTA